MLDFYRGLCYHIGIFRRKKGKTMKEQLLEKIHAMNVIMTSLSDEDLLMPWLEEGVPDGTDTLEDVKDVYGYMTDEELKEEFKSLSILFAKIVRSAIEDGISGWIC